MDKLLKWVSYFNKYDNETVTNEISNEEAYNWLKEEIPLLECPDEDIERAYYFRWWTYRKHIKKTQCGYVITEFLPQVPWSGKHNTIVAPFAHHLREGRWLKNAQKYLGDYINFFVKETTSNQAYSVDFINAVKDFCSVCGLSWIKDGFLDDICAYYDTREAKHITENGLFWSYDDRDAMEFSISGTRDMECVKGLRPTLNSYMYADAKAIAHFAKICGREDIGQKYEQKAKKLKQNINNILLHDGFYKALHPENEDFGKIGEIDMNNVPRELIGYIPWCFGIPEKKYGKAFDLLEDENCFYAETGLTTAEQSDSRFMFEADHECLWNGYVWPFATSQTLNALRNYIVSYKADEKYKKMYCRLFRQYAAMHQITDEDGNTHPWIDEVMHPRKYEWTSREWLKNANWPTEKGGFERGKDYNHSTFCDLLITGIVGVVPCSETLDLNPAIPENWEYFKLENLYFKGKKYNIYYDKTGKKYNKGTGIIKEISAAGI